jgi:hypothetical protein
MNNGAREGMAFAVVALFAYAFWRNPSEQLMLGAIIAAFTTAIGFYLGGSKVGSDTATKNADTLTAIGTATAAAPAATGLAGDPVHVTDDTLDLTGAEARP